MDYREPVNRRAYFKKLYKLNVKYKVHPGLVYLYIPELKKTFGWDEDQTLWFSTINGHTQNPIASLRIFNVLPEIPSSETKWRNFSEWFNENWVNLSYDTDRRKQKKETVKGLQSYADLVKDAGSQRKLWEGKSYKDCWETATQIHSFGRLSSFSYLEYVKISGLNFDCEDLLFRDHKGSKSHRNGMLFLLGMDLHVWDKRRLNSHTGEYKDFEGMCENLETEAEKFLKEFREEVLNEKDVSKFTLESCLCQFKNGFFKRRYPGVYADMGWDRIKWYRERGFEDLVKPFLDIREERLPTWLREECEDPVTLRSKKASQYAETGFPFRGEFLDLP